jgi:hypothetical protein
MDPSFQGHLQAPLEAIHIPSQIVALVMLFKILLLAVLSKIFKVNSIRYLRRVLNAGCLWVVSS